MLWLLLFGLLVIPATSMGPQHTIIGAGASLPRSFYSSLAFLSELSSADVRMEYSGIGSVNGVCRLVQDFSSPECADTSPPLSIDFAASDMRLRDSDYLRYPDLQMYPTAAAAIVPLHHLPDLNTTLVLPLPILSLIFAGNITWWDDPVIVSANPFASLPHHEIQLIARADRAGSTEIFKKALASFYPEFRQLVPVDSGSNWGAAKPYLARGSIGAASAVATIPYSIGYVVYDDARSVAMATAARMTVLEKEHSSVTPSVETIEAALSEFSVSFGNNGEDPARLTADLVNARGTSAWPILGLTYVVMRKHTNLPGRTCAQRNATVNFWIAYYRTNAVRYIAYDRGYGFLPFVMRNHIINRLEADITCEGRPVYLKPPLAVVDIYGPPSLANLFATYIPAYSTESSETSLAFLQSDPYSAPTIETIVRTYTTNFTSLAIVSPTRLKNSRNMAPDLVALPYVAVPFVFIANICSTAPCTSLTLTGPLIARIFGGSTPIAWNDPELVKVNPFLAEYQQPILPFVANDLDDITALTAFARRHDPAFRVSATVLATQTAVITTVVATPWSIAIIPKPQAIPVARFVNTAHLLVNNRIISSQEENVKRCASDTHNPVTNTFDLHASADPLCYPLALPYYALLRRSYSHCVAPHAGDHATRLVDWIMRDLRINVMVGDTEDGVYPLVDVPSARLETTRAIDKIACDDVCIVCAHFNHNEIHPQLKVTVFSLAAIALAACIALALWIALFRQTAVVDQAQPLFLYITLLGAFLTALTPFLLSVEPTYDPDTGHVSDTTAASRACVGALWVYSLGFALTFTPLFAKMWRIRRIFTVSRGHLIRARILGRDVLPVVLVGVAVKVAILGGWHAYDPLRFVVEVERVDSQGRVLESTGMCTNSSAMVFLTILFAFDMVALLAGNWLCYQCRDIPTQFAEGKWISFSLFSWLQSLLVSAPIILLLSVDTDGRFALQSLVVLVQSCAVLSLLFGPKVLLFATRPGSSSRHSFLSPAGSIASTSNLEDKYMSAPSPNLPGW